MLMGREVKGASLILLSWPHQAVGLWWQPPNVCPDGTIGFLVISSCPSPPGPLCQALTSWVEVPFWEFTGSLGILCTELCTLGEHPPVWSDLWESTLLSGLASGGAPSCLASGGAPSCPHFESGAQSSLISSSAIWSP